MDFEQIVLSKQELDDLRRIAQKPVECTTEWKERAKTLCDRKLVEHKIDPVKMQINSYVYQATKDGELYLRYVDRREIEKQAENDRSALSLKEARVANKISIFALIVSVIALIVSVFR